MNLVVNMTTRNAVYVQYQFSLASLKGKNGGFALVSSVFFFFWKRRSTSKKLAMRMGRGGGRGEVPKNIKDKEMIRKVFKNGSGKKNEGGYFLTHTFLSSVLWKTKCE